MPEEFGEQLVLEGFSESYSWRGGEPGQLSIAVAVVNSVLATGADAVTIAFGLSEFPRFLIAARSWILSHREGKQQTGSFSLNAALGDRTIALDVKLEGATASDDAAVLERLNDAVGAWISSAR